MRRDRLDEAGLSRRGLLAAAAGLSLAGGAAYAAPRPFFARHSLPIGLQLYTLGDAVSKDLDGTLARVAAIGYRTVELPSFFGRTPAQLRQALDKAGLKCTSAHALLTAKQDFAKLAEQARVIGFDRVVAPIFSFPPGALKPRPGEAAGDIMARVGREMSPDDWKSQAELLNRAGEALRKEGLRAGYHNHNVEFAPLADGRTGLEILLKETDPKLVCFEMDAGWVAAAGHDPVALLRAHPGRFELMHVKDLKATTTPNNAFKMDPTEVGSGVMNWKRLLPAAYAAGVRRFFVEQEPPFAYDRMEAAKISFDYLDRLVA